MSDRTNCRTAARPDASRLRPDQRARLLADAGAWIRRAERIDDVSDENLGAFFAHQHGAASAIIPALLALLHEGQ